MSGGVGPSSGILLPKGEPPIPFTKTQWAPLLSSSCYQPYQVTPHNTAGLHKGETLKANLALAKRQKVERYALQGAVRPRK
ncbi:hypothetical protein U1Q18_023379, partial [Sarracenia purpurea var. burkii]